MMNKIITKLRNDGNGGKDDNGGKGEESSYFLVTKKVMRSRLPNFKSRHRRECT